MDVDGSGAAGRAPHGGGDAVLGAVLAEVLAASHRTAPQEVPALVAGAARALGLGGAEVFLADLQQRLLVPLPDPELRQPPDALHVDGTLAGRAYRTRRVETSAGPPGTGWVPLADGVEQIGVLRVGAHVPPGPLLDRARALASLVTLLVVSKSAVGDVLVRTVRTRPMSLQSELLWAFTPPRTIGTRSVTSSAALEPAYEVAGDAFDHSLAGDLLHLTVVDAMGHDLASGGASAVALAACRATRRADGTLADIAEAIDTTLTRWIPDRLLTAVIADLDTATGHLSWVNCGHPPPLLIRAGRIVPGALERRAHIPLGIEEHHRPVPVHHARLQPGDRLLVHTDGVTEARSADGDLFGEQRLVDTVVRATATGHPAPEALRRLMHALLAHRDHDLRDDATVMLVEWHPER
ncbi:PP2C family protein-serine/threonine phosphatase [Kitasatospora phosalacinea]|uniref:PP2C family protein-serine/threonine phosphatase n=1 Tax=Kitasatospora phosalacinea TaxID=2065 RepID=UPI00068EE6D0|nr:PP2C family protein-serine/threonine phosphatase [Kitasatospora phosalacinea]